MILIDADLAIEKCNEDLDAVKDLPQRQDGILDAIMNIHECPTIDAVPRQKYEEDMENAFAHGYTDAESNFRKMIADGELVKVVRKGEPKRLIDRQAAIDELKRISFSHWFECGEYLSEDTREIEIISSSKALEVIEALPSAQPEHKKGKWIPVTNGRGGFECDECHNYAPSFQDGVEWLSDYCPNCGARME